MRLLTELSNQQTDLQLRAMSLILQANIHVQQQQSAEATQKTFALAQLIEDTEQLTPRQRQALREEALTLAASLTKKPPLAYKAVKTLCNDGMGFGVADDRAFLDQFIEHWFGEECVAARKALVDSMKKS